jgi:hypothetical protein
VFYDVESRMQIAQEQAQRLRAQAEQQPREPRARLWLSEHLIAAGVRLAPEQSPRRRPLRAA